MSVDVPTLLVVSAFVALISAGLLGLSRFQYRDMQPVMWWAGSQLALAAGLVALVFAGQPPAGTLSVAGFVVLTLSPSLFWLASRRFNGLRAPFLVAAAPSMVLVLTAVLTPFPVLPSVAVLSVALNVGYLLGAAWCLAFQSSQLLLARWPLAILCVVHAVALALIVPDGMLSGQALPLPLRLLFSTIRLEGLVFIVGTTIFIVAAMRESGELRHKLEADTDGLTGLRNRRAFFDTAEGALDRCGRDAAPCAAVVFDLDYFKTINDSFGHPVGDLVLRLFADVVRSTLRQHDVIGRMGGEEFAALIPGVGIEAGVAMADRVRKAFFEAAAQVDGLSVNATVSAGVSVAARLDDINGMLRRADAALYKAKIKGRNRVESIVEQGQGSYSKVARIA